MTKITSMMKNKQLLLWNVIIFQVNSLEMHLNDVLDPKAKTSVEKCFFLLRRSNAKTKKKLCVAYIQKLKKKANFSTLYQCLWREYSQNPKFYINLAIFSSIKHVQTWYSQTEKYVMQIFISWNIMMYGVILEVQIDTL